MIEKIMKAVKSGNKKRGRNITVGAVVGMLLSCTAVMGADKIGLEIGNSGSGIKFSKDGTDFIPGKEDGTDGDPYIDNSWDEGTKTYTNSTTLLGNNDSGNGYGLKLSGTLSEFKAVNNGSIVGSYASGQGIYNDSGTMAELTNNGLIIGTVRGIYNDSGTITELTNNGLIIGTATGSYALSYGINNYSGTITELTNNGSITRTAIGSYGLGCGIYTVLGTITELINNGLITGTVTGNYASGQGIYNTSTTIATLTNKGIIYGNTYAVRNISGAINNFNNYGLLISGFTNVVDGISIVAHSDAGGQNKIKNYGLAFTVDSSGNYKNHGASNVNHNFGETQDATIDGVAYKIRNVEADVNSTNGAITNIKSFKIEGGKLYSDTTEITDGYSTTSNVILNGITNILVVSGEGNELNNSIVNAYKTAIAMNENMTTLTLNNTTANGGVKDSTVNIEGNGNTLTIQGDSIINSSDKAIIITGNNNAVTLEGNAVVNGKMESIGSNTLNFYGKTDDKNMNILHDISGFENMNIKNNVTFFEDVNITGTDEVTVHQGGILSLRLKKDDTMRALEIPKGTHAFSVNGEVLIKGTSTDEAGTLNFVTNGIGKEIIVENIKLENMEIKTSSIIDSAKIYDNYIHLGAGSDLKGIVNPKINRYDSLNKIYKSLYSSTDENLDALRNILSMTFIEENYDYNNGKDIEQLRNLMTYLNSTYTETPCSFSSELSRRSAGMFRDIVTENEFRPNQDNWLIMGGLTHADGGTKDTYYGQNYHGFDTGTSNTKADMKLAGAYMLAKYGYSENLALGLTIGGNKSEAEMSMSKVKGNSGYIGAFAENYRGNLTLKAGAGVQYSEYDADRRTIGGHSYDEKYSDMTYDIYLNGRYSHNIGENLFLELYGILSYTYVDQDGADEGSKVLAIETDSKSFDYTTAKVGIDLKKVIPHEKGNSTVSAGVSYTRILEGADEEFITGRFKDGSDFDILVAHKNEHSIGLNVKYSLELENGALFDIKGTYSVERDSHNQSGKNKTKGEWIVGIGLGYKF